MRQLLFIVALMSAFGLARAAEVEPLKTNRMTIGVAGTLEVLTPPDWTVVQTNMNTPDGAPAFELHAPNDSIAIRLFVRWDGFGGKSIKPTETDMSAIVSDILKKQYLPVAKEKTVALEKMKGPAVTGVYARITDSTWTPVLKNTYPNLAEGMFRCQNIWGNFDLLTSDKNGPQFKAGLKVLESLRRTL
jgi:hypothetical protein